MRNTIIFYGYLVHHSFQCGIEIANISRKYVYGLLHNCIRINKEFSLTDLEHTKMYKNCWNMSMFQIAILDI